MTSPAIEVRGLAKRYGSKTVLADISFACPPGTVTGFLGPNGAGKSTTLRTIGGFVKPDKGQALILGQRYRDLTEPARIAGIMLDAAALHPGRTGIETMKLQSAAIGARKAPVEHLLQEVGLGASGSVRVGKYSLGMRQRLGIAVALVGEPQILILDEPYNGLDPEGIHWIRTRLRDFTRQGGTVLLSSHLLNEVTETVDRLVVIGAGRVLAQGTLAELSAPPALLVRASDPVELSDSLTRAGLSFTYDDDSEATVFADLDTLSRVLHQDRVRLLRLTETPRSSVEDMYFALTQGEKVS